MLILAKSWIVGRIDYSFNCYIKILYIQDNNQNNVCLLVYLCRRKKLIVLEKIKYFYKCKLNMD